MLVIGRQEGQAIKIRDDITIRVLSVKGSDQVRFGISAPLHVTIKRAEISASVKQALAERQPDECSATPAVKRSIE